MRKHQTQIRTIFISAIFILSFILSSCATATPVIPVEVQPFTAQGQVDIPGGLMEVGDGFGELHPAVVFDFQIQSQLVSQLEYAACVEADACEPVGDLLYPAAPAGVTWFQAQNYCSYLGGRLPTEAELTRATRSSEDCPDSGSELIIQEGFGEWVYDWDDPDYYNRSLTTNPFGPLYGDLKVAVGLDLDAVSAAMGKYWIKWDDLKLDEIKLDEIKLDEIKIEEIKLEEIKLEEIKLDEIKFDMYKFFTKDDWQFTKDDWNYTIGVEDGKWFISTDAAGHDKWDPGEGALFPRMGVLPDSSNPLIGFRCVTEGAALTYAPICKTETAAKCSPPAEQMETISAQLTMEGSVNPNFQIVGANCPQGDTFYITISHELSTGDSVEIKAGGKDCECQEYTEYPGKLYCDCPSPGAGLKTEINVCSAGEEILIPVDDFCPDGSHFDLTRGSCVKPTSGEPVVYNLTGTGEDSGGSACPSGPGLPVPQYGPLSLAAASVEGVGESELPEGDQWELFSLSDGSGMCPPGYAYNDETGCCSPYSDENYDCAPEEYFDAGIKQCLPVDWDGCGPCQVYDENKGCIPLKDQEMLSERCNVGNEDEVGRDDLGRSIEPSGDCPEGAYRDPNLGMCLETRDGCAIGYFLDPKTGRCRPLSGHQSPCDEGYTYNPLTGCCVPSPGTGDSECPEGTEFDDSGCSPTEGECPPTHYFDEKTDSCLLREPAECPGGTTKNFIGECIPDVPGVCPDGTEYYPTSGSCPSGPPDPALCAGDKVFDASVGYCVTPASGRLRGGSAGDCDLKDLDTVDLLDEDTPELQKACAGDDSSFNLLPFTMGVDITADPEPAPDPTPEPTPNPESTPDPSSPTEQKKVSTGRVFYIEIDGSFTPIKSYSGGDPPGEGAEGSSGASDDLIFDDPGIFDEIWRCLMLTTGKTAHSGQAFCRSQPGGEGYIENFFTVEFEEGKVASITRVSPNTIDPAEAVAPPGEGTECGYQFVFGEKLDLGSDNEDDEEELISGALPGVSACTPSFLINAGAIFGPENCATLTTTVPICAAPVKPSGGGDGGGNTNICTGQIQSACIKLTGCGWGASCVKCSTEPNPGTCDNLQGCHWDNTNATCVSD